MGRFATREDEVDGLFRLGVFGGAEPGRPGSGSGRIATTRTFTGTPRG
ncbi:MAG TPA: hypothetical protein VHO07_03825 [Streptosporangiaceae bacterium]|jgi:hypothetical protein|nr:hypothetical protein [Streptosporangiaceae bacterium]